MKFLPIHVSTSSHCLLLLIIMILRNDISSMGGELFYVISNHSCLDSLKRYESHCKITITFTGFVYSDGFPGSSVGFRALKRPCTHRVGFLPGVAKTPVHRPSGVSPWRC